MPSSDISRAVDASLRRSLSAPFSRGPDYHGAFAVAVLAGLACLMFPRGQAR